MGSIDNITIVYVLFRTGVRIESYSNEILAFIRCYQLHNADKCRTPRCDD